VTSLGGCRTRRKKRRSESANWKYRVWRWLLPAGLGWKRARAHMHAYGREASIRESRRGRIEGGCGPIMCRVEEVGEGGQQSRAVHQPDPLAFLRLIQSQLGSRFCVGRHKGKCRRRMMAGFCSSSPDRPPSFHPLEQQLSLLSSIRRDVLRQRLCVRSTESRQERSRLSRSFSPCISIVKWIELGGGESAKSLILSDLITLAPTHHLNKGKKKRDPISLPSI
jgi:hypothetical protein